jgi:hypothetical protein
MQTFALFAAEAVNVDAPTMAGVLWQGLVGVVGLAITALLGTITHALALKSADSKYWSLLSKLWAVVQAAVAHAEAELRPEFQKALADGTLTPEEGAALKAATMKLVRESAAGALSELEKSFGVTSGSLLDTLVSGLVERAVTLLKVDATPTTMPAAPPAIAPVTLEGATTSTTAAAKSP